MNITALSDDELRAQILAFGFNAGPVVKSTRRVYQMKLEKLLNEFHSETKPKKIAAEVPVLKDPKPKSKPLEKVTSDTATDVFEESCLTEPNCSPDIAIPKPIHVNTYREEPVLRHNLPDFKRPPLKSTWNELDLSTDLGHSKSTLFHRKDGRGIGDQVDSKANGERKVEEKKKSGSKLSVLAQIIVFLIFFGVVFVVFSNMEPAGKNPFQKEITGQ